jgi:hypothetical protein
MRAGALLAAVLVAGLAGCGGGQAKNPTVEQVKACLHDAGLGAQGGATTPLPGDDNAPDVGEIVVPPSGVFIAFYSSAARAARLAKSIAANGELSRHGGITVLYSHAAGLPPLAPSDRKKIEACV